MIGNNAIAKFNRHRNTAKFRNINFILTFDEWFAIWQASGKWDERGRLSNQYCMARHNDIGPYAIGNVSIQTNRFNIQSSVSRTSWKQSNAIARQDPIWRKNISKTGNGSFKGSVEGTCKLTGKIIILAGKNEINGAGFYHQHVYKCLSGKLKSTGGYEWRRL